MEAKVIVVHALPDRTRLRVRPEQLSAERAQRLADALAAVQGVSRVEIDPRTGGILVSHDASLGAAALSEHARSTLTSMEAPPSPPPPAAVTAIARELHRFFSEADRDLRNATDGVLDLGTATTLTLLSVGALEVAVTQKLPVPPWFNLAWWSFRTFMTTIEDRVASASEASPPATTTKGAES